MKKLRMRLEDYFERLHNNPLPPLNPEFTPESVEWYREVAHSMEMDGFYDKHTREECAAEWRRRFNRLLYQAARRTET